MEALRDYTLALREDISFNFPRMIPSVKYAPVAAPIGVDGLQRRLYGNFVIRITVCICLL